MTYKYQLRGKRRRITKPPTPKKIFAKWRKQFIDKLVIPADAFDKVVSTIDMAEAESRSAVTVYDTSTNPPSVIDAFQLQRIGRGLRKEARTRAKALSFGEFYHTGAKDLVKRITES